MNPPPAKAVNMSWRRKLAYAVLAIGPLIVAAPLTYLLWLPNVPALRTSNPVHTSLMELREQQALRNGQPLKTVYRWKDLKEISPHLAHAVLLSEDDVFYEHKGFDMEQIRLAVKIDWEKKRFAYGGSTLTQQLARSLYLSPRKNIFRKAKEALITLLLERDLSKTRILELYLNVVEWGRGIYGAEAAAQTYFQKPAKDLTPDEAVALASILPSPRRWSPLSERSFMARRRTRLYARMRRAGFLPVETLADLKIPDEVQELANMANSFLQQQAANDNPSSRPSADSEPEVMLNEEDLYVPTHEAPQP
ncbi:MAG TPA: monofunctional biosynthetic peptidoglycan transglycosylase [Elusimicrobiota bacterium]|nr:monofunctional biosynthetic peptidoglycan transglycosylase [Elusimicrobiota bacterium]